MDGDEKSMFLREKQAVNPVKLNMQGDGPIESDNKRAVRRNFIFSGLARMRERDVLAPDQMESWSSRRTVLRPLGSVV